MARKGVTTHRKAVFVYETENNVFESIRKDSVILNKNIQSTKIVMYFLSKRQYIQRNNILIFSNLCRGFFCLHWLKYEKYIELDNNSIILFLTDFIV